MESGNYELMILSMGERERHAISVTNRPLKMPPPSMPLFVICLFQQWPYNVRRRIYSVVQKNVREVDPASTTASRVRDWTAGYVMYSIKRWPFKTKLEIPSL